MPAGRPKSRPEAAYFKGPVFLKVPSPERDPHGKLIGYQWKKLDLIRLLRQVPSDYDPFREAEGFYFCTETARSLAHFIINEVVFPEGKLTGKPFVLEKWQWAIFFNTYCWFDSDTDARRYNEVFIYIPRKNGKTAAFGAIPALISLFIDPEKRSQNFCCAADSDQAALNFSHAAFMMENNPKLITRLTGGKVKRGQRVAEHKNGKYFKVLSSVADTKHGLSPNYVGVDEVHAHPNSELIDVMNTGTAARDSPLTIYTTTADYNRPSVCNDMYKRAKAVASGAQSDPHFLPIVYEAKIEDNWRDELVWRNANPNFGVSVNAKYFRKEIQRVENSPTLLNRFLRLHLNIQTATETAWIFPHIWNKTNPEYKNPLTVPEIRAMMEEYSAWFPITKHDLWKVPAVDIRLKEHANYFTWFFEQAQTLQDEECYGGYDNAATSDIASFCLFFPKRRVILPWFWVPGETIERRSKDDNVPYDNWFSIGLINNTPQRTIDEEQVASVIVDGILDYFNDVRLVAFDRWGANYISQQVQDFGTETVAYPQGFSGMNGPCKKIEEWLDQENLFHGGNPVLKWMNTHCMVKHNHAEQIMPHKGDSSDKIDGIVAAAMAIGGFMYSENNTIDDLPGLKDLEDDK